MKCLNCGEENNPVSKACRNCFNKMKNKGCNREYFEYGVKLECGKEYVGAPEILFCPDCEPKNHSHPGVSYTNSSGSDTFNLSKKIVDLPDVWTNFPFIPVTDIKDFIKKLKFKLGVFTNWKEIGKIIDDLAGGDLI